MDHLLLEAVAAEAARRLVEHEVQRVSHLGHHRYLIRFANAARDNLLVSARPDLPRFHLLTRAGRVREEPPDRFAAFLDQEIGGAVLVALDKRPWDRVIEMRFRLPRREGGEEAARRVVIELVGRSANILVLDPEGTILGYARDLDSQFRAPVAGARYQPPPGREAYAALPPAPGPDDLARAGFTDPVAFLEPLSPVLARDLRALAAAGGESASAALAEILNASRSDSWSPVVHSSRPLDDLKEGDTLGKDDLIVSALQLRALTYPVATPFDSPSEAAEAGFGLLERLRDFQALRDHHRALVRKEVDRLTNLIRKLSEELERARGSDSYRRQGEALLAGLKVARVDGDKAVVPDPYASDGPPLTVPIDPALSLQDNATALFGRYKKGKRGIATIEQRLQAARRRLDEWRALEQPAAEMRGQDDLDRLREAMARLGVVHAPRQPRRALEGRPKEGPARVRQHTTPDGFVILVGKSGDENDTLTFRVASPSDFWLHAADRPGAHVVIRNPRRLRSLPEPTLRVAAEMAAYYSGARDESKVEVHYTQRKHVHKRKGAPSGQVLLRRFRTIQVTPRLPRSSVEDV
jgi:predicted ribosome quality control (RQC) complex YloA/Tae2 family protein